MEDYRFGRGGRETANCIEISIMMNVKTRQLLLPTAERERIPNSGNPMLKESYITRHRERERERGGACSRNWKCFNKIRRRVVKDDFRRASRSQALKACCIPLRSLICISR